MEIYTLLKIGEGPELKKEFTRLGAELVHEEDGLYLWKLPEARSWLMPK